MTAAWRSYWGWRLRRALGIHGHYYSWGDVKARLEDPTQPRASCLGCGRRAR